GYLWLEESAVPHGEWYRVHPNLERRDALRTYRHLITGEQVQRVIARYYSRPSALAPQGHDICLYCGADNGLHGELRVGWCCQLCGGNCGPDATHPLPIWPGSPAPVADRLAGCPCARPAEPPAATRGAPSGRDVNPRRRRPPPPARGHRRASPACSSGSRAHRECS